jgi:hypothetical protein
MKLTKTLFLGSAAGLMAASGAFAADLPVKAKAVEYVKICSLYGAGFYYIPGTDTCIKLGGYMRADAVLGSNSDFNPNQGGTAGARNRMMNYYTFRSREDLNIDTRTATEYGVVRTFFDGVFTWTSGNYTPTGSATGGTQYSGALGLNAAGTALVGSNGSGSVNGTDGNTSAGALGVYYAFIQFAGFTMGKAVSQFDAPWTNYPGNITDNLVGGSGTVTGVNQFTYTADFGQGITAAFSAEDVSAYYQAGNLNMSGATAGGMIGGSYGTNAIGGTRSPNLVAMVRVDQAWGLFQASVAAHDNHVGYYGATEPTGHPDDKWGWAVQLALSIKNIPTGAGDTINIQGVYTDGATRYNFQNLSGSSYALYGNSGIAGSYGSIGFANAPDTVFVGGATPSQQETVKTWGFRGAYTHNWDPNWNSALYGAYAQAQFGTLAKTTLCGAGGGGGVFGGLAGVTGCNPDFAIGQLGVVTRWTPVKNLTFSADVSWTHLDQKYSGTVGISPSATTAKPAAVYELKDQDSIAMILRAQRNR